MYLLKTTMEKWHYKITLPYGEYPKRYFLANCKDQGLTVDTQIKNQSIEYSASTFMHHRPLEMLPSHWLYLLIQWDKGRMGKVASY